MVLYSGCSHCTAAAPALPIAVLGDAVLNAWTAFDVESMMLWLRLQHRSCDSSLFQLTLAKNAVHQVWQRTPN